MRRDSDFENVLSSTLERIEMASRVEPFFAMSAKHLVFNFCPAIFGQIAVGELPPSSICRDEHAKDTVMAHFFWPMTSKQETSWRMPPEKESIASSFDDSSRLVLVSCYCEAFFQKFLLGAMGFAHEVVDLEMDAKVANSQLMEKHMGRVPEAPTGPMPSLPPKTSSMKASDSQKEKINLESRGSCDFQPMIAFKASSAVEKFMVRDVRQDICHFVLCCGDVLMVLGDRKQLFDVNCFCGDHFGWKILS